MALETRRLGTPCTCSNCTGRDPLPAFLALPEPDGYLSPEVWDHCDMERYDTYDQSVDGWRPTWLALAFWGLVFVVFAIGATILAAYETTSRFPFEHEKAFLRLTWALLAFLAACGVVSQLGLHYGWWKP